VSGVLYGLFRCVRGIPYTVFHVETARAWAKQPHGLWAAHARDAVAPDGSPTGFEVAIVYDGRPLPFVIQLRARWVDRDGARWLRDLVLGSEAVAIALMEQSHAAARLAPKDEDGRHAVAIDLDPVHALAAHATADTLLTKLENYPLPTRDDAMSPRALARAWAEVRRRSDVTEPLPALPDAERRLIDAIEADPRSDAAAHAYADYLEHRGRFAEARVLR